MYRRYKGSISIFLAMIFMIIVALIISVLDYVSISSNITAIHMIDSLSVDSTFSAYDRDLLEEYGLLFIDYDEASLASKLDEYMRYNSDNNKGLMDIKADGATVLKLYTAGQDGGKLFEREVIDYMKYAFPIDTGMDIVKELLGISEDSPTKTASDSLVELCDEVIETTEYFYKLMTYLDGVKTDDMGIVTEDLRVVTNDYFGKSLSIHTDPISLGINNKYIYAELMDKTINPINELFRYKAFILEYSAAPNNYNQVAIINEYFYLKDYVENTYENLSNAYNNLLFIEALAYSMDKKADNLAKFLDENKDNINDELRDSILSEIDNFRNYKNKQVNGLCDVDSLIANIKRNIAILDKFSFLKSYNMVFEGEREYKLYMDYLDDAITAFYDYRNDDLTIDYSRIDIFGKCNFAPLKLIKGLYEKGILSLVTIGEDVSKKTIPTKYIASNAYSSPYDMVDGMVRNVTFNEYVLDKFVSYSDKVDTNYLDYEIEYVIGGHKSDEENLATACSEIIGLRTVPNFGYLLTDNEKKLEAETLAVSLVGAIGIPAVVTATKYAILGAWGYGESILDVKNMLKGKKIPVIKNKNTFGLSLEKLISMDFNSDKDNSYGLKYEDYLRFLLFLRNYGKKNEATMNLVELHMLNGKSTTFSMKDMVCGADILSKYSYKGDKTYIRQSTYCY